MRWNRTEQGAQGHTLLELVIVMAILGIFTAALIQLFLYIQAAQEGQERQVTELQAARSSVYQILRELPMVGYPANNTFIAPSGAEGFLEATPTTLVFEADFNLDGVVERIEYRLAADGRSLGRRVFPKQLDGSLGAPIASQEPFVQNLANQTLMNPLPVFSWEVDPDSPKPFPNNIVIVYVSLAVEARLDPHDPGEKQIIHLAGAARRINPSQ